MTLATTVYVTTPARPADVFEELVRIVVANSDDRDDAITGHTPGEYRTQVGQGLCGIANVTYNGDGPLQPDPETCNKWCETPCDDPHNTPPHVLSVGIDTAYGYSDSRRRGCNQLHADIVTELGRWFDARGIEWKWQNEYTGDVFNRYDGLDKFAGRTA